MFLSLTGVLGVAELCNKVNGKNTSSHREQTMYGIA